MRKVGTTARFKKGMMVTIKPTYKSDGVTPRTRWAQDAEGKYADTGVIETRQIWRKVTDEDMAAWRDSDASKGMNCAGETKLPPQSSYRTPAADEVFRVVRARVKARRGWHEISGCAQIEDADGNLWYAVRTDLH